MRTYDDLTPEEQRILVDGVDVTATIAPMAYAPRTPLSEAQVARRNILYNTALDYGKRPGAVVDINAAGSASVRYWDTFWNTVATATDSTWHATNYDFDILLRGWLAGGARIRDHRLQPGR